MDGSEVGAECRHKVDDRDLHFGEGTDPSAPPLELATSSLSRSRDAEISFDRQRSTGNRSPVSSDDLAEVLVKVQMEATATRRVFEADIERLRGQVAGLLADRDSALVWMLLVDEKFARKLEAQDVDETLFDYYVNLVKNFATGVPSFDLPTDARMYEPENKTAEEYGEEFDFIVIGGGSTGCIIANRLSEVEKWSVLLLEAGTFPGPDLSRIPALSSSNVQSRYNWGYRSTPQEYACLGNSDAICNLPRGKGIGGTSLIHGTMYSRGNKLDYKKWADLLNDRSYTYRKLLPYFLKTENFTRTNFDAPIDWKYHGTKGPMHMTQSISSSVLQEAIIEGSKELGNRIVDYNRKTQLGTGIVQYYNRNGFRDDPGLAFISSAENRTNLKVLDKSYVIKLDISPDTNRINGVIFTRNNKTYIARNRKEVILSAGVIGSPQILMLSGIGPEDHLKSLDIPVIKNLPVGETLRDHVYVNLTFTSNFSMANASIEQLVRELLKGEGLLTSKVSSNCVSYLKISEKNDDDNPDMEILFYVIYLNTYTDIPNPFNTIVALMHPKSKGSIRLKNKDPFEYPLINTNYLSNDEDMEQLYKAFEIVLQFTETEPFRRMNVTLAPSDPDECNQTQPLTKEFWFCYLRRRTGSTGHLISTCLTGTNPENGVVDKYLKVFGLKDLRVADSSVIPFPFAHHTSATCYVIAEKLSDQIKKEYCEDLK